MSVGVGVGVAVGIGVAVGVGEGTGVLVGIGVAVGTDVGVGVCVDVGAGEVAVGTSGRTSLTTTVCVAFIWTVAVLPDLLMRGPTHSSTIQPGLGSTSILTVRPEMYPPSSSGGGLSRISAALLGSTLTSNLWVIVAEEGRRVGTVSITGMEVGGGTRVGDGLVD